MSDEGQQTVQLWVRTEKAQVFGPLSATSVELLLDNGVIVGRVQVSLDGENYVFPGRMPGVRVIFPREVWGEPVVEGAALDEEWKSTVALPPALPGTERPASAPAAVPSNVRAPAGPVPNRVPGPPPPGAGQVRTPRYTGSQPSRAPVPVPQAKPASPSGPLPQVSMTSAALFDDLEQPSTPRQPPSSAPSAVRPVSSPSTVQAVRAAVPGPPLASSASSVTPGAFASAPAGGPPMQAARVPGPPVASSASNVTSGAFASAPAGGPPMQAARVPGPPVASSSSSLAPGSMPRPGPSAAATGSTPSTVRAAPAAPVAPLAVNLPDSGDLADFPVRRLYALCAASNSTALLTLYLHDRELFIHFRKGSPEFVDSSHAEDTLQAFLLTQGLATPQQIGLADAQKARFGGELLPALFGLGLINPSSAFQQLSERAATLVFRALSSARGSFTLQAQDLPQGKSMPLGNRWSVYLEQLRRMPTHEVQRQMAGSMDLPVMRGEGLVPMTDLRLQPQEARAVTFFDGTRTLAQVERESGIEGDVCVRTAWMLSELELVTFAAVSQPAPGPRASSPSPAPARPVASRPPGVGAAPVASAPVVMVQPVASQPVVAPPSPSSPKSPPAMPSGVRAPAPGPPPGAPGRSTVPYPGAKPQPPPVASVVAHVAVAPAAAPPRPVITPQSSSPVARPVITSGLAAPLSGPPAAPVPAAPAPAPPVARPMSGVLPNAAPTARPASGVLPNAGARPASGVLPAARSASGTLSPPVSTDPKQLAATLETMKSQNYFEVLNLPRTADSNAVKVGYLKMARNYHPDTVPPGSPESVVKAMADIFALIGEANRTLSDQKLRADYLAEVEAGTAGEKVDVAHLLQAEELFQRGCILVKARKFVEAVKALDEAIKMNDREGEYLGWRGYARYFTIEDKTKGLQEALKEVNQSLKINPNAAPVHYFQGFLYKAAGDLAKAKASFQSCVALDSRHIDAQRELRMMK